MTIVLANWFNPELIRIADLDINAGILISIPAFLLCALITEVYGYKFARRAIWCGFLFSIFLMLYGQAVIYMPNPNYPTHNAMFDPLLATNIKLALASTLAYFAAQPLNAYIMAKQKIKWRGRNLGLRLLIATAITAGISSIIFNLVISYGTSSPLNLSTVIYATLFIKLAVLLCGLPPTIYLINKLKRVENSDVYDDHSNFSVLSLNTEYSAGIGKDTCT